MTARVTERRSVSSIGCIFVRATFLTRGDVFNRRLEFLQAFVADAQATQASHSITVKRLSTRPDRPRPARWSAAAAPVLVAHGAVLMALMWARPEPPVSRIDETPAIVVSLIESPPPPPPPPAPAPDPAPAPEPEASSPPPGPKSAPPATAPKPLPPVPRAARPRRVVAQPPPDVEPLPAAPAPPGPPLPLLGAAQLAGAMTAGPGSGGGDGDGPGGGGSGSGAGSGNGAGANGGRCDMVRRVQDRLRRTPSVRTAVSEAGRSMNASGRAILVWDGDWLQSQGQSGKGLAGVRQAIALEVAFSPPECKNQPMQGLAVLDIQDGGARLALGKSSWRWSDLLSAG